MNAFTLIISIIVGIGWLPVGHTKRVAIVAQGLILAAIVAAV